MLASQIIDAIKFELKKSKITYQALAKELKVTEAGVKKMLTRSDLSLERALEICKVMNLPLSEIISKSEGAERSDLRFTVQQTEFLAKNYEYFHFYMKLAYEQKSPAEIQKEFDLSINSLNLYLKKLEQLGLIKRHPKDRAQIMGGLQLAVNTSGTALEKLKTQTLKDLIGFYEQTHQGSINGAGLHLTAAEAEEFQCRWADLVREFSIVSGRHRKSKAKGTLPLSVMLVQVPISMFRQIRNL